MNLTLRHVVLWHLLCILMMAVIICGPDELANGMATVKNLAARSQRTVSIDALAGEVKGMVKIRISGVGVS